MIKNATIYRIANPAALTSVAAMEEAMQAFAYVPCGETQDRAIGWHEPRGEDHGAILELIDGQRILKVMIETKVVPAAQVRKAAQEAADKIEADTGRKPGKKQMKELREDALQALLPNAFARQSAVWIWIDPVANLLVIGSVTQRQVDEAVTLLIRTFDSLQLQLLQTQVTPQAAMTQWLMDTAPESFHVERECELRSGDEDKAVVRFSRHSLDNDQVRKHVAEGKLPTRLALSWEGRVGFVLDSHMRLRKITFLEGVFDGRSEDDAASAFDADVALTTGELRRLIPALMEALGGELVVGAGLPDAPGGV
jgi:recombination associated protein RdgC